LLFAATLPALSEAAGIAGAMAATPAPYIISFVLGENGRLLGGTRLADAIEFIDSRTSPRPLCYMANCCHPTFLEPALEETQRGAPYTLRRFQGLQANASALSAEELDNRAEIDAGDPGALAEQMLNLRERFGLKILGGCCGTDNRLIEKIARFVKHERRLEAALTQARRDIADGKFRTESAGEHIKRVSGKRTPG
jgi:S-methylmethionine-dependent homocysteine/selenocysteine methylase